MNDKMLFVCLHNRFVDCGNFNCSRCGWDPANKALRNRRVIKVLEKCQKPKGRKLQLVSQPNLRRPIYCPELNKVFPTKAEAARETGVDATSICRIVIGDRLSAKGLTFYEVE